MASPVLLRSKDGRLRILHVVNSLEIGGTACALASLIERTRDLVEHRVLCIRTGGPIAQHLQTRGVPVFALHKLLIDAIEIVAVRHSRVQLLLIGDGKEREALQRRIAELALGAKVRLLGLRDDIPALLNALDIFVLPAPAAATFSGISHWNRW